MNHGLEPRLHRGADLTGDLTTSRPLGLPGTIRACLFDLDGVLTDTAPDHAAAWKDVLDDYLARRALERGEPFLPFDPVGDYLTLVDGRRSEDGVRAFLESRGIEPPEREPTGSGLATIARLAKQKNARVLERFRRGGVRPFDDAVRYVDEALRQGLPCGVVSSSSNCRVVLAEAGIAGLFQVVVDAPAATRARLAGKPAPDMYLAGARALGVLPGSTAVFEDAPAGVSAARSGRFGYVVGIARRDGTAALDGADVIVASFDALVGAGAP